MTDAMTVATDSGFPQEYTIHSKIGRGGTADIFLAKRDGVSRPVVLKRFYVPSAQQLVERERRVALRARFPGILRVHRVGESADGAPFLEMEYCDGPSLEALIGRVDEPKLLAILSAVASSLHVFHTAGFVHNDLKPSNIFCPPGFEHDDFRSTQLVRLKLADFSLADTVSSSEESAVTGTVGYMSPEMILRRRITPASDLFSLGVMAYQLACGRMPFRSDNDDPLEINAQVTEGERPELCGPAELFSPATADLIRSLLEIDPSARPASAFILMELLSKAGSAYPFRRAIRPRHLIGGADQIDPAALIRLFGAGSFSDDQMDFIERATGLDWSCVRILLEHNFDRDHFARMTGRWGWRHENVDVIDWPDRLIRYSLRPLRGQPTSVKQLALAMAVLQQDELAEHAATVITGDSRETLAQWNELPQNCRRAIVHSLDRAMGMAARTILSSRLAALFRDREDYRALAGRLLYYAGEYAAAIEHILTAAKTGKSRRDHMLSLTLLELARDAAQKINDIGGEGRVLARRAYLEKEMGDIAKAEITYLSVFDLLEGTEHDDIIGEVCKALGDLYKSRSDYAAGIKVLDRALKIYTQNGDQLGLSHTLNNLGNLYWISGRLDKALDHYLQALAIQREIKSREGIASSLSNIGTVYCIKGDYQKGIEYFRESLEIKEQIGDKGEIAVTWNNLGLANLLIGNVSQAIEAYTHALALNREIGDTLEQLINIQNLTEAMIQAGQLHGALEHLREGATLAERLNDNGQRSSCAYLTGQLMRRMGYYDDAEKRLTDALALAKGIDNKPLLIPCYVNLAYNHLAMKSPDMAEKNILAAKNIAESLGDKNALFHIALFQLQLSRDDADGSEAASLASELNTPREKALLALVFLELNNRKGVTDGSEDHLSTANEYFTGCDRDIDQARFHLAAGDYLMLCDSLEEAGIHYRTAKKLADDLSLLPEQWQCAAALSEFAFKQKDLEQSFAYARLATTILKKIAAKINDPDRLGRFYNDSRIVALLGRIKSLQSVLAKSKGAV